MNYPSKIATTDTDCLFRAILSLETVEDCYRFFEDLCTIKEIKDMTLRFKVAKMLTAKVSYQIITAETNASTATIGRVNKSLIYGADGYKIVFDKMKKG